jgi:flavin-binding protein dodecin
MPNGTPCRIRVVTPSGAAAVVGQRYHATEKSKETEMAQKVIDVVGTSKESFAKAAENAVAEAAKTVRGMKWARVAELEMELDGKKIVKYRTTTKIYLDIEK